MPILGVRAEGEAFEISNGSPEVLTLAAGLNLPRD